MIAGRPYPDHPFRDLDPKGRKRWLAISATLALSVNNMLTMPSIRGQLNTWELSVLGTIARMLANTEGRSGISEAQWRVLEHVADKISPDVNSAQRTPASAQRTLDAPHHTPA